ncbi:MAG TPA: hypothetical protein V6C97_02545, partial [Oculatellaceae cyanobacterium]
KDPIQYLKHWLVEYNEFICGSGCSLTINTTQTIAGEEQKGDKAIVEKKMTQGEVLTAVLLEFLEEYRERCTAKPPESFGNEFKL